MTIAEGKVIIGLSVKKYRSRSEDMSFFDKLENRFGRYAVRNLMMILIVLYVAGFILNLLNPTFYFEYLSLNMAMIFKGQI